MMRRAICALGTLTLAPGCQVAPENLTYLPLPDALRHVVEHPDQFRNATGPQSPPAVASSAAPADRSAMDGCWGLIADSEAQFAGVPATRLYEAVSIDDSTGKIQRWLLLMDPLVFFPVMGVTTGTLVQRNDRTLEVRYDSDIRIGLPGRGIEFVNPNRDDFDPIPIDWTASVNGDFLNVWYDETPNNEVWRYRRFDCAE